MPVILATRRQRSGGLQIEASLGKQFMSPYLENTQHKIGLAECLKWWSTCLANVRPWAQTLVLSPQKCGDNPFYLIINWQMNVLYCAYHINMYAVLLIALRKQPKRKAIFSIKHPGPYLFLQQIFTEYLQGARNCSGYWRCNNKQNNLSDFIILNSSIVKNFK
jgi:hypothetical protein